MNDKLCESLSALIDDEANELELARVLSQASTDERLRRTWTRYSLAQQAVHGEQLAHKDWDISARVQSALRNSHTGEASAPGTALRQRLLRPIVSIAVAASVTITVVFGGQQLAQLGSADPYSLEERSVAASASPVGMLNSLGAVTVQASYGTQAIPVLQPATRTAYQELAQQRLRRYMQEHAEQAALNSPQGLVPFARVPEIRE